MGHFSNDTETSHTMQKLSGKKKELSGQSENFTDVLESFYTMWKLSRHYRNFPDNMESVHKIYRQPLNFQDNQ